jgi:flagellar biosynthesis anti-sigma factor FlgM
MRINDSYSKLPVDQVKAATPPATVDRSQTASATQSAVQVTVSTQARALASAPPIDLNEVKVARLRSAIDSGAFSIDSAKIATRIVEGD